MYLANLAPVSNRATWLDVVELVDDETGEAITLDDYTITVELRDEGGCTVLSGSTGDGVVTIVDTGCFQWAFTPAQMAALGEAIYDLGCTISDGTETAQLMIGRLPVMDGVVRA